MSTTNLRQQAGGNPSQGPVADMANPTPGPNVGGDFPDAPDEEVAARPQDKPDPDEFAKRLGLGRTSPTGRSAAQRSKQVVTERAESMFDRLKPAMTKVADVVSHGFDAASERLTGLVDRVEHGVEESDADPDLGDLIERVDGVRTVMVTTADERGTLSSRPLKVQRVDGAGDVFFIVNLDADWVTPQLDAVNVAFVRRGRDWISVAGRASISNDRALLDELWDAVTDAHDPGGKDSGAVVLRVHADRWEYWSSPNDVAKFIETARAIVTDDAADVGGSGTVET